MSRDGEMDVFRLIGGSESESEDETEAESEEEYGIEYNESLESSKEDMALDIEDALKIMRTGVCGRDVWMSIWREMMNNFEAMRRRNDNVAIEIFDACLRTIASSSSNDVTIVEHILVSLISIGEDVREHLRTCDRVRDLEGCLKNTRSRERCILLTRAAKILISNTERFEKLRTDLEYTMYELDRPNQMIPLRRFEFADDLTLNISQRGVVLGVVRKGEGSWRAVARATGHVAWASGIALCRWLISKRDLVKHKRVLDLGSGTGLVGLLCRKLGAASVTLTDLPEVLKHLKHNADLNELSVNIESLQWGVFDLKKKTLKCDVVVAAGVVVNESQFEPLCKTIQSLLSSNVDEADNDDKINKKYMLLAYQQRRSLVESKFFDLLCSSRYGLRFECLDRVLEEGKSIQIFKIEKNDSLLENE